jgi:ribosome-associated translation inhibitor RaiA
MDISIQFEKKLKAAVEHANIAEKVREKIHRTFSRFADVIVKAQVSLKDLNGPKGGVDKECRITLLLASGKKILASSAHSLLEAAVSEASEKSQRLLVRHTERKQQPQSASSSHWQV